MRLNHENPSMRLISWNNHLGMIFQTDIEIAFDCELFNQIMEVKETLRVQISGNAISQR